MPTEPLALSTVRSAPLEEADYDAICTAMTATARGRWFLEEYARRNRNCDTNEVLAAIARMEAAVVDDRAKHAQQRAKQAQQEVRIELLEMARTIAQARADVTAGRGEIPPAPAEPASAPATPDITSAAERLRQIAWTVRACGIELPASEQIEQVAEAILSAGVLHTLGEQQTARLTEVLHYLEHRVDRMLDNQLAAAAGGEPAPAIVPPRAKAHDADSLASPAPDFPLAMADMTAANTNEAEPVPARLPVVEHSAQEVPAPILAPIPAATAASPAEPPTLAVVTEAAAPPAMDVAQHASPAAIPTTKAPEPAASPPAIAPLAVAPAPAGRAPEAIAPIAAPKVITPKAAPEAIAPKATAPMPAANLVTAAAPTPTVALGDRLVAEVVADAIAAQVDDDLNELTDIAAPETEQRVAAHTAQAAAWSEPLLEEPASTPEEDPADFLLEAPPGNAASTRAVDNVPTAEMTAAPTAGAKVATAQMSTVLAAIATELLTNGIPETQAQPLATSGALAAVMAMSEEERIALFS